MGGGGGSLTGYESLNEPIFPIVALYHTALRHPEGMGEFSIVEHNQ